MEVNPTVFNLTHFCLSNHAETNPNKPCLITLNKDGDEQIWTYKGFYDKILQVASGLVTTPLKSGSRIAICSTKNADLLILYFAAIAASFVPIPIQGHLSKEEVEFLVNDSQASLYYQDPKVALDIELPKFCDRMTPKQLEEFSHFQVSPFLFNTSFNDPAYIAYTTKQPKGVVHAHRVMLGREPIRSSYLNINSSDIVLQIGRPNWTYYMGIGAMEPWCSGATTILYTDEETPKVIYQLIEQYRVTLISTHRGLYQDMLNTRPPSQSAIKNIRHAILSGESATPDIREFWEKGYKIPFYDSFSTMEFANFISEGPNVPHINGSIGKIQPNRRVIILNPNDRDSPCITHETGLLAAHRHNLGFMQGYFNQPEFEKKSFHHSWFLTGDLARIDEQGYIWLEGKIDL